MPPLSGRGAFGIAGAAAFGVLVAVVRERAQSLWPAVLFHILAAIAAILAAGLF